MRLENLKQRNSIVLNDAFKTIATAARMYSALTKYKIFSFRAGVSCRCYKFYLGHLALQKGGSDTKIT